MKTKKNNDEVGKSFDIGTKIEYDGKSYKVIESDSCADCSIASICSSSGISGGIDIGSTLFRDKRINIFGECSSLKRPDTKSVVFMEVPTSKEPKVYNTVSYKIDDNHKYITIDIPEGFIIDTENSDLSKGLIVFKDKWLNLKQLYKSAKDNNYHTCLSEIKDSTDDKTCEVREKLIALSNLMDIARYFNGNWEYHNNGNNCGYMIAYDKTKITNDGYQVVHINSDTDMYFGNIMFKNEADAQYVIDNPNFRDILDSIFKV